MELERQQARTNREIAAMLILTFGVVVTIGLFAFLVGAILMGVM